MSLKREIKDAYIEGGNSIYVTTHSNAVYVDKNETETLTQRLDNVKSKIDNNTSQLEQKIYYYNTAIDMIIDNKIKINSVIKTLGFYSINDGGEGFYKISNNKNILSISLQNGLYANVIYTKSINPLQIGAKLNGIDDDSLYINNILTIANISFPFNKKCLIDNIINIPTNREVDFNNSTLVIGGSGKIKIGDIPNAKYTQFIIIKNAIIDTSSLTKEKTVFDCKQTIFLQFKNINIPSIPPNVTIFDMLNCFNFMFDNCNMGYYGSGIINANSKGIYIHETNSNIISGSNNCTNVLIKDCLIQCIETGIYLNGNSGVIDTLEMQNIGFSYNTNCILCEGGSENVNININTMRTEFSTNGIVNNNRLNINGLHCYDTENCIVNSGIIIITDYAVRGNGGKNVLINTGSAYFNSHVATRNDNVITPGNLNRSFHSNIYEGTPETIGSLISKFNNTTIIMNSDFDLSNLPSSSEYEGVKVKIICNTRLTITGGLYNNSYTFGDYQIAELLRKNGKWYVFGGANTKG